MEERKLRPAKDRLHSQLCFLNLVDLCLEDDGLSARKWSELVMKRAICLARIDEIKEEMQK